MYIYICRCIYTCIYIYMYIYIYIYIIITSLQTRTRHDAHKVTYEEGSAAAFERCRITSNQTSCNMSRHIQKSHVTQDHFTSHFT